MAFSLDFVKITTMNTHLDIRLDIQNACTEPLPVSNEQLQTWVNTALKPHKTKAELTIRFVDADEIHALNATYRKQDKPTNVLAFPASVPDAVQSALALEYPLLGDVIICPTVLESESRTWHTPLVAHYAHITIHGVLHLLGYDHIDAHDAAIMQALEIEALASLAFENPYLSSEDNALD